MNKGLTSKMYYNEGTEGTPSWTENDNIVDLNLPSEYATAPSASRASSVETFETLLRNHTTTFTMLDKDDNDHVDFFMTAHYTDAVVDLLILNGARTTVGKTGVRGDFKVSKFNRGQPLNGVNTFDVEIVPYESATNAAASYTVPAPPPGP